MWNPICSPSLQSSLPASRDSWVRSVPRLHSLCLSRKLSPEDRLRYNNDTRSVLHSLTVHVKEQTVGHHDILVEFPLPLRIISDRFSSLGRNRKASISELVGDLRKIS